MEIDLARIDLQFEKVRERDKTNDGRCNFWSMLSVYFREGYKAALADIEDAKTNKQHPQETTAIHQCPTCGAACTIGGEDKEGTHYYVPV